MLAIKRSPGVTAEVNLRKHTPCAPPPNVNKAVKSRDDIIRSKKQGFHKKGLVSTKKRFKKKISSYVLFSRSFNVCFRSHTRNDNKFPMTPTGTRTG